MKKEIRLAIQQGIKEADKNGYMWTITPNGLKWSYGEEFTFIENHIDEDEIFLTVKANGYGATMASLIVGSSRFCDCHTMEDAYRIATKATIRNANNTY